jgi:hypothetical protein
VYQAIARRRKESEQLEDRTVFVSTVAELDNEMAKAEGKLVVLEITASESCEIDAEHAINPNSCQGLKHSFQRTARDCPDAVFIEVAIESDSEDSKALLETLGAEVIPTLQFIRSGRLLWEHRGITNLDTDLAEGVLFYGDAGGDGMHPSDYITEIRSKADLEKWTKSLKHEELGVLDISANGAASCIHIYPTVVVLARQFKGYASFARMIADTNDETNDIAKVLDIKAVPTFAFYRDEGVVGSHVGTSRSDLISAILSKQGELGLAPPPPEQGRQARFKQSAAAAKKADKGKKNRWNNLK